MELCFYGAIEENDKNNIYVFGSHQYALYYWTRALREKKISPKSQLIHIDYHPDILTPVIDIDTTVSPEDIRQLIENGKIHHDSFIKPAISMGIIDNVTFCCYPAPHQSVGDFKNYISPINLVDELNKYLNDEANNTEDKLFSNISYDSIILDIDLDFFFEPKGLDDVLRPKSKKDIKKEVHAINRLFSYATITTIATSPEMYRQEFRDKVESVFSDCFAVPIDFSKPMPVKPL